MIVEEKADDRKRVIRLSNAILKLLSKEDWTMAARALVFTLARMIVSIPLKEDGLKNLLSKQVKLVRRKLHVKREDERFTN